MAKYKLVLIGPFGLFAPDGARIEVTSKKAIALIALLATAPSGERSRKWLQTMLWGSREETQAQGSLRRELSTLGKLLERHGAGHLLHRTTQRVQLATDRFEIDIDALGTQSDGLRAQTGDFLEGVDLPDCEEFEDWLRDERSRVDDIREATARLPAPPAPVANVLGSQPPTTDEVLGNAAPRLPPKPSLAVLPFDRLGNVEAWLGQAIADEVGVILSQFPQLFIVASSAARALTAQTVARQDIARQLGVRYLLDGSVAQIGDRLRVSVTLIEGQTDEQLWGETFVGPADDLFELQKDIATQIAPQIWSKVDVVERRNSLRRPGPVSGNYEAYWRANALFRSWERDAVLEAIRLADQLSADDPTCPWSTSLAGYCHSIAYALDYSDDRDETLRTAVRHYQSATRFGEDNVEALGYAAGTLINIGGDLEIADRLIAHALNLLPAHQPVLFWGGWVDLGLGRAERARERFELALRINPATGVRSPTLTGMGFAALISNNIQDASRLFDEAAHAVPPFPFASIGRFLVGMLSGDQSVIADAAVRLPPGRGTSAFLGRFVRPEQRKAVAAMIENARTETPSFAFH